jgi:hypothetical protein
MKLKQTGMALAVILAALLALMGGCVSAQGERNPVIQTDEGKDYATINAKGVSFKNESGSLTINNQASFDVIIFAGKVENGNVMGGVKAGAGRSFNLSKLPLPERKGSFLIRAAAFETYSKKNLRVTEEDVIYSGLVVFDLTDPGDRTNLNIFKGVDKTASSFIYATNNSNFVLELRLGTPTGEKIATLPPLLENKKIWIEPLPDGLPYRFYATYVYVDPRTNEITSIVPNSKKDSDWAYPDKNSANITPMRFEGPQGGGGIGYQVAFVRINNGSSEGLQFRNAGTILADQKGIRFTASGRQGVYEIPATLSGDDGQPYTGLLLEFARTGEVPMRHNPPSRPVSFKPGYIYDLVITPEFNWDIKPAGRKNLMDDSRINLFFEAGN